jgi:hypothetical protein
MITRRVAFLMLLSASIGYGIHDYSRYIASKLINRIHLIPTKSTSAGIPNNGSASQFLTTVTFDGKSFHPDAVTLDTGNYLLIVNKSRTEMMRIASDVPGLSTNRGYAEGEQIQYMVREAGSFSFRDTLHPAARVTVTVVQE